MMKVLTRVAYVNDNKYLYNRDKQIELESHFDRVIGKYKCAVSIEYDTLLSEKGYILAIWALEKTEEENIKIFSEIKEYLSDNGLSFIEKEMYLLWDEGIVYREFK